ncbi:ketopantoate reductase family protein [Amphibiibacter pelophylacis]|uniref:Ketopantoate reductase family protein n=1 Tax=Amphibiibacter pelophylacis TaxID=1799477 RepID=A0ACC6P5P9_9BURK
MKILILGAGGIGGYFGAQLLRAGADVTYLLRPRRQTLIQSDGLTIETPTGRFTVHPPTVTADTVQPGYDLILLAPKAYDLDDALHALEGALAGPGQAVVLPFLNGLDHLERLDARLGRERVMGGVAHIAATLTADGAVRQLSPMHRLTVGPRHESHRDLAQQFVALCQTAPFDSVLADDIEQVLWDKWVFLATLAGMTTACAGSVGDIVATPYGRDTTLAMFEECCSVARLSGHPVGDAARAPALELLTAPGSSFTASMLRDLQGGQRTEHDHILGALVARGDRLGVPTPLLRLAHTRLAVQAALGA